eukprot:2537944-Amphidinium_carterae.1
MITQLATSLSIVPVSWVLQLLSPIPISSVSEVSSFTLVRRMGWKTSWRLRLNAADTNSSSKECVLESQTPQGGQCESWDGIHQATIAGGDAFSLAVTAELTHY